MMTKKDYIKFAEMIAERKVYNAELYKKYPEKESQIDWAESELSDIKWDMIEIFEQDNPNFDIDRFNACIDKRVNELTNQ